MSCLCAHACPRLSKNKTRKYMQLDKSSSSTLLSWTSPRSCDSGDDTDRASTPSPGRRPINIFVSVSVSPRSGRVAELAALPFEPATHGGFHVRIDRSRPPLESSHEHPTAQSPRGRSMRRSRPRRGSLSFSYSAGRALEWSKSREASVSTGEMSAIDALMLFSGWLCRVADPRSSTDIVLWLAGPPWRFCQALVDSCLTTTVTSSWPLSTTMCVDARTAIPEWPAGLSWMWAQKTSLPPLPLPTDSTNDALGSKGSALDAVFLMRAVFDKACTSASAAMATVSPLLLATEISAAAGRQIRTITALHEVFDIIGRTAANEMPVAESTPLSPRRLWKRTKKRGREEAEEMVRREAFGGRLNPIIPDVVDFFEHNLLAQRWEFL